MKNAKNTATARKPKPAAEAKKKPFCWPKYAPDGSRYMLCVVTPSRKRIREVELTEEQFCMLSLVAYQFPQHRKA